MKASWRGRLIPDGGDVLRAWPHSSELQIISWLFFRHQINLQPPPAAPSSRFYILAPSGCPSYELCSLWCVKNAHLGFTDLIVSLWFSGLSEPCHATLDVYSALSKHPAWRVHLTSDHIGDRSFSSFKSALPFLHMLEVPDFIIRDWNQIWKARSL